MREERLAGARYAPAEPSWRDRPMYGSGSGDAKPSPPASRAPQRTAPPQRPTAESVNSVLSFFATTEAGAVRPIAIRAARPPPPPKARRRSYKRGTRVRHEQFGDGTILTMEGSGPDAKLTVYFDRVGSKKFIAKYAKLTRA